MGTKKYNSCPLYYIKKLYYKGFLSIILNNHYNNPVCEFINGILVPIIRL